MFRSYKPVDEDLQKSTVPPAKPENVDHLIDQELGKAKEPPVVEEIVNYFLLFNNFILLIFFFFLGSIEFSPQETRLGFETRRVQETDQIGKTNATFDRRSHS